MTINNALGLKKSKKCTKNRLCNRCKTGTLGPRNKSGICKNCREEIFNIGTEY